MTNPYISNIKTIAVVTVRRPGPQPASEDERCLIRSLMKELHAGRYVAIPLYGKNGEEQDSVVVLNISLETTISCCRRHSQTSFIFLTNNEGILEGGYWEVQDLSKPHARKSNPYVKKDAFSSVAAIDDADNCSISVRGIRITIPFSILSQIDHNLGRLIKFNRISDKDGIIEYTINKVGQSPYIWRKAIYNGIL